MLSYRHAFHAGNHADVLKHAVLIHILAYLTEKPKPLLIVDTHAGAGRYDLQGDYATKSGEYVEGIAKLWTVKDLPPLLHDYVEAVRAGNRDGQLRFYPGSPALAQTWLRPGDGLRLFELHPTDVDLLARQFGGDGQIRIARADGFDALRSLLPPPSRRGLVIMDPAYEVKTDYARALDAIGEGLTRFATGTYAIWYPCLQRSESRLLPGRLRKLAQQRGARSWLRVELAIAKPTPDGFGLHRSGMFVINPPWTLRAALDAAAPACRALLGRDGPAVLEIEGGEFAAAEPR